MRLAATDLAGLINLNALKKIDTEAETRAQSVEDFRPRRGRQMPGKLPCREVYDPRVDTVDVETTVSATAWAAGLDSDRSAGASDRRVDGREVQGRETGPVHRRAPRGAGGRLDKRRERHDRGCQELRVRHPERVAR